jgi:hypothetical protein
MGLRLDPRGMRFLISEVPLYTPMSQHTYMGFWRDLKGAPREALFLGARANGSHQIELLPGGFSWAHHPEAGSPWRIHWHRDRERALGGAPVDVRSQARVCCSQLFDEAVDPVGGQG